MVGGMTGSFGVYGIYVTLWEVYDEMKLERGKTVVTMVSNCVVGMVILFMMLIHSFTHATYFKIASTLHIIAVLPLMLIRKY